MVLPLCQSTSLDNFMAEVLNHQGGGDEIILEMSDAPHLRQRAHVSYLGTISEVNCYQFGRLSS